MLDGASKYPYAHVQSIVTNHEEQMLASGASVIEPILFSFIFFWVDF